MAAFFDLKKYEIVYVHYQILAFLQPKQNWCYIEPYLNVKYFELFTYEIALSKHCHLKTGKIFFHLDDLDK